MQFEMMNDIPHGAFELTEGLVLRPWALTGLFNFIQARLHEASQEGRYRVLASMSHGDLFYAYQDKQSGEIWTVQVMTTGTVLSVDMAPSVRQAILNMTETMTVDLEDVL